MPTIFPHTMQLVTWPSGPTPQFWSGSESGSCLSCQSTWSCQGEVLRLQTRLGIRWYPSSSLLEPSSHSCICHGLFFFFTQEVFYHLGILSTFGLMNEEGASLPVPTLAPALKWPLLLLPASEFVNPSSTGPMRVPKCQLGRLVPLFRPMGRADNQVICQLLEQGLGGL